MGSTGRGHHIGSTIGAGITATRLIMRGTGPVGYPAPPSRNLRAPEYRMLENIATFPARRRRQWALQYAPSILNASPEAG